MRAGRLRHRISIERLASGQDPDTGEMLQNQWVPVYSSVPAAIEPLSAREFIAAKGEQAEITTRITIRYKEVAADMRIIHKGRIYSIEGPPLPDPKSGLEYLTILCSSGVNNG